jgi:hypothetical protein
LGREHRGVHANLTARYGGLDVAVASLKRQHREDLVWIVGDDLFADRTYTYASTARKVPFAIRVFDTAKIREQTGMPGSLESAYCEAIRIARELDADLFVSMQDYIWAPPDGIDRFMQLAEEHPRSLLTGLCSLSADPEPDLITNPEGLYSIFAEPYTRKPKKIGWRDCRLELHSGVQRCNATAWEINWAAIPRDLLHHPELDFDPAYDRGHYYGNQAYALKAFLLGFDAWIDCGNEAIGLPHKAYFPEQQAVLEARNNRLFHEQRLRSAGVTQR